MIAASLGESVDSTNGRAGPGAWFTLWVLVLVTLFAFADRQMLALVTAPLAISLKLSDGNLGVIQGLGSAVFAMIAVYPLGWLSDRYDRRVVLGSCVLVWAVGTAACGLANSYHGLFLAVLAISAGEAVLPPLSYSAIPDLFQGRQRVAANQVFYVASILSGAAGLMLGGAASVALDAMNGMLPAALQGFEPWRVLFLLVAAPAPILILLIAVSKLARRRAVPSSPNKREPSPEFGPYLRQHGVAIMLVFAALCAYGLPFGAVLAWTPAVLERLFGATPASTGFGLGIALAGGCVIGVTAAAWLMRRLTPRLGACAPLRIACWTLLASLPIAILFPFVTGSGQLFALVALQMLSGTLIGSLLPNIIQGLAPGPFRGRVTAIYSIVSVITSGFGITAVGWFSDALVGNSRGLLIAMSSMLAGCWLLGAILMRLAERPYERTLVAIGEEPAATDIPGMTQPQASPARSA